jgi:hypothetical protein
MARRALHTDRLKSADYDARTRRLEIEMSSGELRVYVAVPEEVARRFFASPNPAAFWEDRIAEEYVVERGSDGGGTDAARSKLDALFGPPKH